MRFELVKAHAFGPFQDETLELAPGMNVVYGPNEAGKSSWRAALYAGLCGARRRKGTPTKEEREFAERHKPWSGGAWEVGAVVALDGGRVVELRHDLAGRVDSSAVDASRAGRDYSGEIFIDGAPDGSKWLGLNRRTFLSVACVRQAGVLEILENPGALQDDMQRAAATAGADETAARALAILDSYRRDEVGTNHPASKKPLRQSETRARQARAALKVAQEANASYLQRRADVVRREQDAKEAWRRADAVAAALAEYEAIQAEQRLEQGRQLNAEFPEGAPRLSPEREGVADQAAAALNAWESRPSLTEPDGPTAEEYDRRVAEGNARLVAARAAVAEREAQEAERHLGRIRELSAHFPDGQPPRLSADDEELALQARQAIMDWEAWSSRAPLKEPSGRNVEDIEKELADFDSTAAPTPPSSRILPFTALAIGLVAAVAGIGVAVSLPDFRAWGIPLAVIGIVGAGGALRWQAAARSREQARAEREQVVLNVARNSIVQRLEDRRKEESDYQAERERRSDALGNLAAAAAACGSDAAEPAEQAQALRDWQERRRKALREYEELGKQWDELQQQLGGSSAEEVAAEAERLRRDAMSLVDSADAALLASARTRNLSREWLAELDRETQENRVKWERARVERQNADERYALAVKAVNAATDALRAAAVAAQVEADDADGLAERLREWQERRKQSIAEAEERSKRWDELQQLLGENSLEQVESEAARLRADADKRAKDVGENELAEAKSGQPSDDLLESLRSEAKQVEDDWRAERGQLDEYEKSLPSVADAEDELDEAEREWRRWSQLSETLEMTAGFLKEAQDKVHRDIAPLLKATVLERLPQVTGGRYTDCFIDPADLRVEVSGQGGQRRNAALLSHGTAEQVYLLLRLALARHLTKGSGETCPLILDDVVGASDSERKQAVLETLLAISETNQVILFTHEDDVRDWARERLTLPPHSVLELDGSAIAP